LERAYQEQHFRSLGGIHTDERSSLCVILHDDEETFPCGAARTLGITGHAPFSIRSIEGDTFETIVIQRLVFLFLRSCFRQPYDLGLLRSA